MHTDQKLLNELLSSYNQVIGRLVLYGINELPFPLTVKRTIDVLKGNWNSFIQSNELDNLGSFSLLPGFTRDQLSDMIDRLISHELVVVQKVLEDGEEFAVIGIGEPGKKYLEQPDHGPIDLLEIILDKEAADIPEEDLDLYYKLKLARRQLAEEYDYPAFMICSDETLHALCKMKPMETNELIRLHGINETFMQLYSKQFLYVIRQYVTREKGS